jgi:hypothetical protein
VNVHEDAKMYELLQRLRSKGVLSVRDLTSEEICLAEKLVELKLAAKLSTNTNSFYFYGGIKYE